MIVKDCEIGLDKFTTGEDWNPFLSKNLMMQNDGGGSCGQSMQMMAYIVYVFGQEDGQTDSFKLATTGEGKIPRKESKLCVGQAN